MGQRERDPRLQKLFDEGKKVYSISKLNTIENCEYEAWNTYIQHIRGKDGIYGLMGSKVHDVLQGIIDGNNTEEDLLPALNAELSDMDMLGINFPKDFKGGNTIRDNWIADMTHFCKNFVKPNGKFTTEELVIYKINEDRYLQGYIDLIRHNKDGSISIFDWKTSTNFSKEDLLHSGRQLIFYSLAKEQEGFKVKNVAWIMLKYVEVSFMGKARSNSKTETLIIKVINRGKLISELHPYLEKDLEDYGIDELDAEILIEEAKASNSLSSLPKDIQDKYKIKPYVRSYELTDELRQETLGYINRMADLFEIKSDEEIEWKPRDFTKVNKSGKVSDDTFFCNVLCNHRDTCKYIKKFNDLKVINKTDDDDLF